MVYQFEKFELDMNRVELRALGRPVPVEPQVFSLLAYLVEHRDRMVSKEELHERIWNGRIVSDAALSSRIRSARQAIGDDGRNQRLIRTVHSNGFRFLGTVTSIAEAASTSAPPSTAATPSIMQRPTIAVLPFANLSGDAAQEYFSDAVTADIIATLSRHRWLSVLARNTAFGFKGRAVDVRQLASELGVSYVVEGTVQREGNRIRVSAQLADAFTGTTKWSERYDRNVEDVFAVQDEITETLVARVEPEIGFAERRKVARSGSRDLAAWESFHLGLAHFFKFTAADNVEAQRLLQRSRELDSAFGEAHAWWAYAVILGMVYWDTEPTRALLDQALAATKSALELDDQNGAFHALKGRVQLARCEYEQAIAANGRAIALNSTLAAAHCGLADSLAYEGRYDEAMPRFEKALALSPNDPQR
ncbi:MAG: winged helix-turn-helix domain-containing protein, partial [Verrucomicrobiales bacterium]|nr:winged helix-turn-helix domain-containing protein [Verrucomicrobiales bacterium]